MEAASTVIAVIAAVVSAVVGGVVWRGDRTNKYRQSFVLLSGLVALWILSNVLFVAVDDELRFPFALISYAAAMALSVQLLIFSLQFAQWRLSGVWSVWITVPGIVMTFLSSLPNVIAYGIKDQTILTHSSALVIYGIVLLAYLLSSCAVLVIARSKANYRSRQIINVVLVGMSASIVAGAYCNLVLPLLNSYSLTQLGPASAVLFVAAVAYAIVKHGLFDVRLGVVRSVAYFMVLASLAAIYLFAAWLLSGVLSLSFAGPVQLVVNMAIALVFATLLQPLKLFFDRWTSRVFYRDNYSSDEFFARLSHELGTTTDLRVLLQQASDEIGTTFAAEQSFLYVQYGPEEHYMTAGTPRHSHLTVEDIGRINATAIDSNGSVILTNLLDKTTALYRVLARHDIALVLPLQWGRGTLSYLFLGAQKSRDYTQRDIHVLETVADELAIAIQNALSLHDVQEINATLQDRIDAATKELRDSNEQLQRLDEAKDEFVSMASHQLRTPLTSVKGYISMVLEGDAGKINPMQRQLLGEAFTSSERMVHLINDFLNVSRLQTGKFMVDRRALDLAKVIAQEVDSLQTTAQAHALKLRYRAPSHFPTLYLDEGKIRQVAMNFIDNAIYYSREHTTITVSLYIDSGDAVLEVHDTGIGVPEKERAHLFTKFFRATNARKQRPDGTGVGLFLAKKVIVAHGGNIVFDSVEGEGSTFGFRLPIKKLSSAPAESAD